MTRSPSCAAALLALALLAPGTPCRGEELEQPGYTLTLPAGWRVLQPGPQWIVVPPGTPGEFVVAPAGGEPLGAGLEATFAARWRATVQGKKVLEEAPAEGHPGPDGRAWRVGAAAVEEEGAPMMLLLLGAEVGRQVEFFLVLATPQALERHGAAAEGMLLGARFKGAAPTPAPTPPPLSPAPAGGGLSGIWVTWTLHLKATGLDPQVLPDVDFLLFFPDGTLLWKLPPDGLAGLDAAQARAAWPSHAGRYQLDGQRLRWRVGGTEREYLLGPDRRALERRWRTPDGVEHVGETYTPRDGADGLRLDARYVCDGHQRETGVPSLVLAGDGSFQDAGLVRLCLAPGRDEPLPGFEARVRPGSGTYAIAQNTLTLRYADGRTSRLALVVLDLERPDALGLGQRVVRRWLGQ